MREVAKRQRQAPARYSPQTSPAHRKRSLPSSETGTESADDEAAQARPRKKVAVTGTGGKAAGGKFSASPKASQQAAQKQASGSNPALGHRSESELRAALKRSETQVQRLGKANEGLEAQLTAVTAVLRSVEQRVNLLEDDMQCAVCMDTRKEVVFSCGHQTCQACSASIKACPWCTKKVKNPIRLFF